MKIPQKYATGIMFEDNYSLLPDGVDEAVNIDGILTNELASTTKGTWSAWVRPVDATPTGSEYLISFGDTDANSYMSIHIDSGGLLRYFARDAGGFKCDLRTDASPFADATWAHVALVQDGVSPVLYIDAVAVAQTFFDTTDKGWWFNDDAGLDNGRCCALNKNSGGNAGFFNGHDNEVSFWDTNFTAGEITELYNGGKPSNLQCHSKATNLVGWPRMGEDATYSGGVWTIPDASDNNNDSTSILMEELDRVELVP